MIEPPESQEPRPDEDWLGPPPAAARSAVRDISVIALGIILAAVVLALASLSIRAYGDWQVRKAEARSAEIHQGRCDIAESLRFAGIETSPPDPSCLAH